MTAIVPPKTILSTAVREPAHVAEAMRAVVRIFTDRPDQEISLSATGKGFLASLLLAWADVLDRAPRVAAHDPSDAYPVSEALLQLADRWHAENSVTDGLFLDFGQAQGAVAALRKLAHRATELQIRAAGFRFDDDARQRAELTAKPQEAASPIHPDDIVPGITTGNGDPVTYALLERLKARRACGARPGDTEESRR